MSDKSFGDYANRNIVKNPLLSTAVTGLSLEDLTHNAVLVPVAPNQGLITGSDQTGSNTQTLANADHELTNLPSGDSNSNILPTQPSISTHSITLDSQTSHQHDRKPDIPLATVSKASAKSEDDFDVNEYFARLQGTRYVSAPLHSHQDPTNLAAAEENLEEINLNDDKNGEVQQSLTADIAQNFSQLPNVLPHVASAVFSSFSNMWNMKSREQTPDDRIQSYQDVHFNRNPVSNQFQGNQGSSYQDVQFQGSQSPGFGQFQGGSGLGVGVPSVPLMSTEEVVKEVAPPPKEPPVCGTTSFRLATKKKYAQIPGLSTRETKPIAFNPITSNVPSYFIPKDTNQHDIGKIGQTKEPVEALEKASASVEQKQTYDIFNPANTTATAAFTAATAANDGPPSGFMPIDHPKPMAEIEQPQINLQNQMPVIPPPPMFSTQRKDSQSAKLVLPPSVARRIGSNHPVIKQQVLQPTATDNIFVPTFDTPGSGIQEPQTSYGLPMFAPSISQHQEQPTLPPPPIQIPPSNVVGPDSQIPPPISKSLFASINPEPANKTATQFYNPIPSNQGIFTPDLVSTSGSVPSISSSIFPQEPTSLPLTSNIFHPPPSTESHSGAIQSKFGNLFASPPSTMPPPGPIQPSTGPTLFDPTPPTLATNVPVQAELPPIGRPHIASPVSQAVYPQIATASVAEPTPDPPKPPIEPPKAVGASNFRMTKKRPQYYSGPIEGIGSISTSIKPIIPTVDPVTFQGALFTPEQPPVDTNAPSFDITKQTEPVTSYTPFDIANPVTNLPTTSFSSQPEYPSYDVTQPAPDYSLQYNTAFDLSRSLTDNYEYKEDTKESKGFGIIGSLKSKLSSIDINKIQNSVTTFFDPAYNESKKDATATQEKAPYPTQCQTQSNFEIFVPNIEQSQSYYSYQPDQSTYEQTNKGYINRYNFQGQSPQFPEQNITYQSYPSNYYSLPTQNLNQTQISSDFTEDTNTEKLIQDIVKVLDDTPETLEHVDANNKQKIDVTDIPASFPQNAPQSIIKAADTAPVKNESNLLLTTEAKHEDIKTFIEPGTAYAIDSNKLETAPSSQVTFNRSPGLPSHGFTPYGSTIVHDPITTGYLPTIAPNTRDSSFYSGNIFGEEKIVPPPPIASEIKSSLAPKVKYEDKKPFSAFSNVSFENKEKEMNPMDLFLKEKWDVKTKEETLKGDSLLVSLTKGEIPPIIGVATVPLFGLSTMIADKSKEIETPEEIMPLFEKAQNLDMLDRTTSMSFFENIGTLPQRTRDTTNILDNSSSFSFFERAPLDKDVGLGAQVPSVSFFTNNSKLDDCDTTTNVDVMLDKKPISFDNIGAVTEEFGLEKEIVLDSEKAGIPDDIENVSELNICETCREVNKPDDKDTDDDVTTHLIENLTSRIQLSNAVEVPFTEEENTERVEFDAGQSEEISHISEETIETIHVQSANELLKEDDIKMSYGWATDDKFPSNPPKNNGFGYKVEDGSIGFSGDSRFNDYASANANEEQRAELKQQEDLEPSAPPAEDDSKSDEAGVLDVHSIELDAKEDFPLFEEFVIEPSETEDDKIELKEKEMAEESNLDSFTNRVEKFKKMEEVAEVDEPRTMPKYFVVGQPISMASYFDTGNYAAETHYKNTISSSNQMSIPPGFEEEFKKRLALAKAKADGKMVPETQTQTGTTISLTTSHNIMPVGFNVEANVSKIVDDKSEVTSPTSSIFASGSIEMPKASSIFSASVEESITSSNLASASAKPQNILGSGANTSEASNIFGLADSNLPGPSSLFNTEMTKTDKDEPKLPDPMNFFSDSPPTAQTENFSRLASYFNSPPKTEHAKSFFELSQSQNHYRHATIPEKYRDLIKDLTSVQNLTIPPEQNVKQVNYFSVDHDVLSPEFKIMDNKDTSDTDDNELDVLTNCRHCVNLIVNKRFKVKAAVNENTEKSDSGPEMHETIDQNITRHSMTVNFEDLPTGADDQIIGAMAENRATSDYSPVKHHWFYRVDVEDKSIWRGFSITDSRALETAHLSSDLNENTVVPTDGGRYDVNVVGRLRVPVYWNDKPTNVRRCSWFYKGTTDPRYIPYTELVADKLEMEYRHGVSTGDWHRRMLLPNGEVVVMHGPSVMVHFLSSDAFTTPPYFSFGKRVYRNPPKIRVSRDQPSKIDHLIFMVHGAGEYRSQKEKSQSTSRPRVVRRGHDESEIEDPEPSSIDHLLLLCHGVGSACDMRFRSVEEVVEDFRATSLQLVQSHYKNSYDQGIVNRVEVLPISWHSTLHSGETGVDRRLAQITLDSIPRLRNFTNDTVLDVLFYTSPVFCQTILNTVCKELNRIYDLFKLRNPGFKGGVSLGGHSLGSVILYDLLCHQMSPEERRDSLQSNKSYVSGNAGTGQPYVQYPILHFQPDALYALGSPIAIFECIRGVASLGLDFALPTCKNFFNIFHPYDPIAYRIEPLINPSLRDLKPDLIPHHKGRKRMHLELKDTMARVGADLKQKLIESLRSTWNKWKAQPADGTLERVVEAEIESDPLCEEESAKEKELSTPENLGHLNSGRRVDYVLQEAPLEMINEYLFAMSSHVGYWESEDTMLLMLREIYSSLGIQPDSTVPQQSMSVERTKSQDGRSILNAEFPSTSGSAP